jgi:hypothetical protein
MRPTTAPSEYIKSAKKRLMNKIVKTTDGCWHWVGSLNIQGYGQFHFNGGPILAHHATLFILKGKIVPFGLETDHLCRVHDCVNPKHLEIVTYSINALRGNTGKHMLGRKQSAETVEKRVAKLRGKKCTPEQRLWMSQCMLAADNRKGRVVSQELRDRISVTMRGRVPSESHRKALSRALLKYNAEKRKT